MYCVGRLSLCLHRCISVFTSGIERLPQQIWKHCKKHIQIPQYLNQTSEMEYNNSVFINSTYWHSSFSDDQKLICGCPSARINQSICQSITGGKWKTNFFFNHSWIFRWFPLQFKVVLGHIIQQITDTIYKLIFSHWFFLRQLYNNNMLQ